MQGNQFVSTDAPLTLSGVSDLSGVSGNTASGTPAQRAFSFVGCTVTDTWAIEPATKAIFTLARTDVAAGLLITITPGAIVKGTTSYQGGPAMTVSGSLVVPGTSAAPVTLTSAHDDAAGGDTDGSTLAPSVGDFHLWLLTGSVSLDQVNMRYASLTTPADGSGANGWNLAITNSSLRDFFQFEASSASPTTLRLQSNTVTDVPYLDMGVNTATITSNVFTRAPVRLGPGAVQVQGNQFVSTDAPLTLSGVSDRSRASGNTAVGHASPAGVQLRRVHLLRHLGHRTGHQSHLHPGPHRRRLWGDHDHQPRRHRQGSTYYANDTLEVQQGGGLNASHATFTADNDDSAGGDTNGDGPSTPGDWTGIEAQSSAQRWP